MQSVYQQQLRRHTNATQCQVTAPHTRHKKSIIESRTLNWLRPNFKRSRAATYSCYGRPPAADSPAEVMARSLFVFLHAAAISLHLCFLVMAVYGHRKERDEIISLMQAATC
jgi:hypothetical protein